MISRDKFQGLKRYINKGFCEDAAYHPVLRWTDLMETTKFPGIRPYSQIRPFKMIKFRKEFNNLSTIFYVYTYFDDEYTFTFYKCSVCNEVFTSPTSFAHHYHLNNTKVYHNYHLFL